MKKQPLHTYNLSIAVITKDRPEVLKDWLLSIGRQSKLPDNIIIIDSSIDQLTRKYTKKFLSRMPFPSTYIYEPKKGYSVARNRALNVVKTPWLGFIDDDCIVDANWYSAMIKTAHRHRHAAAIAGESKTYYPKNILALTSQAIELYWKIKSRDGETIRDLEVLDTKNILYNVAFLNTHHLSFDKTDIGIQGADDCDMGMQIQQAGGVAFYAPNAIVFHKDSTNIWDYSRIKIQRTIAHVLYEQKWKRFRKTLTVRRKSKIAFMQKFAKANTLSLKSRLVLYSYLFLTSILVWYVKMRCAIQTYKFCNAKYLELRVQ
jgi:glycosyltransferase involved in cell wall biosynthesis